MKKLNKNKNEIDNTNKLTEIALKMRMMGMVIYIGDVIMVVSIMVEVTMCINKYKCQKIYIHTKPLGICYKYLHEMEKEKFDNLLFAFVTRHMAILLRIEMRDYFHLRLR